MCTKEDFMEYLDYHYGLCYRFNQGRDLSGRVVNISTLGLAGLKQGLQLELYAGHKSQEKYMQTRGFRIIVFNKSDVNQMGQDVGIDVATGLNTNIAVQRTFTTHLSAPHGNCLPTDIAKINWNQNDVLKFMYDNYIDGSYYKPTNYSSWTTERWHWTLTYSQFFCLKMCFMKYLYENCKCYDIKVPLTPKNQDRYLERACVRGNEVDCMREKQRRFYSNAELFGPCYAKCPIECERIKYDLRVHTSTYPTEWYAELLNNSTAFNETINLYFDSINMTQISYAGNYEGLRSSVARINVYYEDLSYVSINETPAMTFDLFLGSLGGNMGLFLGLHLVLICM
jgi:amiloride-sensitive sodium channel subunit delta